MSLLINVKHQNILSLILENKRNLQKIVSEISDFITQNTKLSIIQNPEGFPKTPFKYLFLPEKNLVFHCVSLEIWVTESDFFQNISNEFRAKNLKIVHIWQDVWQTKRAIVQSRILSLLGLSVTIPARLTQVRRIDKPTLDKFLTNNHLQGKTNAKLKYGLFLPNRYFRVLQNHAIAQSLSYANELLVAVASFSNAKKIIREGRDFRSYELIRFANLSGFTVVGGLNKLLKNFIVEQSPDDIMTYADGDWSDGSNYEKIGFDRIEQTPPLRFELDSQTLTRVLTEDSTKNQTIFNAGNWKFLMKLK